MKRVPIQAPVAPVAYEAPVQPEHRAFEPLRAAAYPQSRMVETQPAPQSDFQFEEPAAPVQPIAQAPVYEATPQVVEVPHPTPVARIVDPMVEDDEPMPEEAFALRPIDYADDHRAPRGGFLSSLFGRQRQAPEAPQYRHQAPVQSSHSHDDQAEDGDDLEIPSFLRRLAN